MAACRIAPIDTPTTLALEVLGNMDKKLHWEKNWIPRSSDALSIYVTMGLLSASLLSKQLLEVIYSVMTTLYWLNMVGMCVSHSIELTHS